MYDFWNALCCCHGVSIGALPFLFLIITFVFCFRSISSNLSSKVWVYLRAGTAKDSTPDFLLRMRCSGTFTEGLNEYDFCSDSSINSTCRESFVWRAAMSFSIRAMKSHPFFETLRMSACCCLLFSRHWEASDDRRSCKTSLILLLLRVLLLSSLSRKSFVFRWVFWYATFFLRHLSLVQIIDLVIISPYDCVLPHFGQRSLSMSTFALYSSSAERVWNNQQR